MFRRRSRSGAMSVDSLSQTRPLLSSIHRLVKTFEKCLKTVKKKHLNKVDFFRSFEKDGKTFGNNWRKNICMIQCLRTKFHKWPLFTSILQIGLFFFKKINLACEKQKQLKPTCLVTLKSDIIAPPSSLNLIFISGLESPFLPKSKLGSSFRLD